MDKQQFNVLPIQLGMALFSVKVKKKKCPFGTWSYQVEATDADHAKNIALPKFVAANFLPNVTIADLTATNLQPQKKY